MSDHDLSDNEITIDSGGSRAGWFAAGAFSVATVIGLFLYTDGYFGKSNSVEVNVDTPKVIIEGN